MRGLKAHKVLDAYTWGMVYYHTASNEVYGQQLVRLLTCGPCAYDKGLLQGYARCVLHSKALNFPSRT